MSPILRHAFLTILAVVPAASTTSAQDGKVTPDIPISGLYRLASVSPGSTAVSMDFSAVLFNPGDRDVEGSIVLRDPAVAERVFSIFGEYTIPAHGSVRVSDVVSIPREIYDSWSSGNSPAVFVNISNDRGGRALHRVTLMRGPVGAPN